MNWWLQWIVVPVAGVAVYRSGKWILLRALKGARR